MDCHKRAKLDKYTVVWILILYYHIHVNLEVKYNCWQETPTSRFVLGYIGAVSSAIGIAVSLKKEYCMNYHTCVFLRIKDSFITQRESIFICFYILGSR